MANCSWFVVCCLIVSSQLGTDAANVPSQSAAIARGWGNRASKDVDHSSRSSLDSTTPSTLMDSADPNNASSSMYFHQVFSKETKGATETKLGPVQQQQQQQLLQQQPSPAVINHPTSIQAVNQTVNGGNLTSSETQQYYGYEPTGINKRHVHYPPVPMDVINDERNDDGNHDGDGDDYDNDDVDDSDDYDGDGGSGEDQQNSPQQQPDDDGEEKDDAPDDDFDHSASFAIPKIDPNHKGCKTVYKEIQTGPGKVKTLDEDFDADFAFKRRRKRSAVPKSATASSFVIARECHFTDDGNERKKLVSPLSPPAAVVPLALPNPMPIPSQMGAPIAPPHTGPLPESAKPKVTTGESRFVPINADPWRSPRGPRGVGFGGNGGSKNGGLQYDYKVTSTPFMEADENAVKDANRRFNKDEGDSRHYHKYPYPHYHIYYNRPGESVFPGNSQQQYSGQTQALPQQPASTDAEGDNSETDPTTYESPNSYFEFTGNPNGGEEEPNYQSNQDDDDDEGNGDNPEGDEQGDDGELNNSPSEGRASRNRRGVNGRYRHGRPPLPLPPTLSPSRSAGLANDEGYGWSISGPNFYKTGLYEGGDGKKKPKKYSYKFFRREDPDKADTSDSDGDSHPPPRRAYKRRPMMAKRRRQHQPLEAEPRQHNTEISHEIHHAPPRGAKKRSLLNDDDDYNISYGAGNFKEYDHEYDSDKDRKKNRNRHQDQHQDDDGNGHEEGGDGSGGGYYQDYSRDDGNHNDQGDGQEEDDYKK